MKCTLLTLLAGMVAITCAVTAKPADSPNVLFIMTDDLNCNLGCYGHPLVKTPSLDRLAAQGLTFDRAYTNFPLCGPSRASFMTGLYPEQNGVTVLRRMFRNYVPDAVTMSQHFMANDYAVARVGKIYHYDNPKGVGTNSHDDPASWQTRINPRGRDKDEEHLIFSLNPGSFGATLSWLAADGTDEEQTDGMVATESIKLMKKYKAAGKPFFIGAGFYKPHTPFVAPKKYFDMYDLEDIVIPEVPEGYLDTIPMPAQKTVTAFKNQIDLPEETARKAIHAYYATISFMDAQVGRLLDALDELGIADNTIILFSSDHGYHMGEHGHYQKKTLFEDADQVPLILYAPGMKEAGKRTDSFAEMIDFYRTLTDLAGLSDPPQYVMGKSLAPLLQNSRKQIRKSALTQLENGYTLRTGNWRFTRWDTGECELYDRSSDPAEMINLASNPEYKNRIQNFSKQLEARILEATTLPTGLSFTPPDPRDKGLTLTQAIELDP